MLPLMKFEIGAPLSSSVLQRRRSARVADLRRAVSRCPQTHALIHTHTYIHTLITHTQYFLPTLTHNNSYLLIHDQYYTYTHLDIHTHTHV